MKSISRLDESIQPAVYESTVTLHSTAVPGVSFTISRMSFGRRMDLLRQIRELAGKLPFLESSNDFGEKLEATFLQQAIEELYLRWGLLAIAGLTIDGAPATTDSLIEKGPEELTREIAAAIKSQCGLSEEARKN